MNAISHPKREDYIPIVRNFLPSAEGEQLTLRASLLLMRDRAMATKPIACEESWHLLDLVERTAARDAFRPMSDAELTELRRLLVMCVATASSFDTLFIHAPALAAQLAAGEPDARG